MVKDAISSQTWRARAISFLLIFLFCAAAAPDAQPVMAVGLDLQSSRTKPLTVQMNSTSINKTALPMAIAEIDLRVGGGTYPGCMDELETPVVDYKIDQIDLTGITLIATCGWQPDETVKVTLMDPDGKFFTSEVKAVPSKNRKDIYQVNITFQPGVDSPEGKYRFTLQGSATIKTPVFFNKPKGAMLYAVSQDRFDPVFKALGGQHILRLEGFLPNESVKLLAYRFEGSTAKFYGWQDFITDGTGRLIVETNLPEIGNDTEMNFYAYAQETHSVHMERFSPDGVRVSRQFDMDLYCPGAQTSRITSGKAIKPVAGMPTVSVHYQPGFGSRLTIQAPGDTPMRVFDQPKCIDHAYWWKVSLSKPILFGWAAESFLGKYLIEPVQ
ncbi:MAG: hypothetical protein IH586_07930 [Anaerolineaceae bacterium]|nr:hypothetical protein [Anaerolineaceae bacterium]